MITVRNIFLLLISLLIVSSCNKKDETEFVDDPVKNNGDKKEQTVNKLSADSLKKTDQKSINDPSNPEAEISPLEAKNYIGRKVIVRGFVADVHRTEKVAYLNFVERYPKNPFTAVIFASKFYDFGDIILYEGKQVEVVGLVSEFKGKAQIVLNSNSQIKIIK